MIVTVIIIVIIISVSIFFIIVITINIIVVIVKNYSMANPMHFVSYCRSSMIIISQRIKWTYILL